eukprot:TRINITY_DN3041_c0_g1_i9.p1 TRINITY_DN3041_c0_g1~~TRINITY_DN3041_c0_g1_i9.p1  ORF type:complete len:195 (+),score=33.21 TRINITY_DN3041_c0_g1_i9:500-1084(+)
MDHQDPPSPLIKWAPQPPHLQSYPRGPCEHLIFNLQAIAPSTDLIGLNFGRYGARICGFGHFQPKVLFHRFYCKKSFARFNVKRVAASCVWLVSKLEESPRKAKHVLRVFHRMECRRENLPIENVDPFSKKYSELKMDLNGTERHLLKEMGFICHVEHPYKFISNYLATLETPPELRQEAWNLANDSLWTTMCV